MPKVNNITGKEFGRLLVINLEHKDRHRNIYVRCRCRCGNTVIVQAGALKNGHTKSCGCLQREKSAERMSKIGRTNRQHGETGNNITAEHRIWAGLKDRSTNPRSKDWRNYGGRGITVCDRWRYSYISFLKDMGRRPTSTHSIDRIDNDKGYYPSNCRWATAKEQAKNRRPKCRNLKHTRQ